MALKILLNLRAMDVDHGVTVTINDNALSVVNSVLNFTVTNHLQQFFRA